LISLQNDFALLNGRQMGASDQWANAFAFAPSISIPLPHIPYHLVNQLSIPVVWVPVPFIERNPFEPFAIHYQQKSGLGDITMTNYLTRTLTADESWVLGAGPAWGFPSASFNGAGTYAVGPAVLAGYFGVGKPFWAYLAIDQSWSFGGGSGREASAASFQYFYQINLNYLDGLQDLPGGDWAIGAAPASPRTGRLKTSGACRSARVSSTRRRSAD